MSVKITYFAHGTTTDNENGISSGWNDVELSLLGINQARNLTKKIKKENFAVIYCSDLKRAYDTARLAFGENAPIITDKRLRECNYGDYNGQPSSIVESMQEKHIKERFPNGESYKDVEAGVAGFLKLLKDHYNGKAVAIVAHKAPQLALEVLLQGRTWEGAFTDDWRKTKVWKPGWEYIVT